MIRVTASEIPVPNMIQELPWTQAMQVIKESGQFQDFGAFRAHMEEHLPYNSAATRERYAQTIIKYFFPEASLGGLPERAWRTYRDDELLASLMRYQFLSQEPTVAQFVVDHLLPLAPGSILDLTLAKAFVQEVDPKNRSKMVERLGLALRRMGFIVREHQQDTVALLWPPKISLVIMIHYLFAPTPRIVTLRDILANPFWYYLGFREEESVRRILHEANARSSIASYAVVDQLEQITTRYTLGEWFEKRLQL